MAARVVTGVEMLAARRSVDSAFGVESSEASREGMTVDALPEVMLDVRHHTMAEMMISLLDVRALCESELRVITSVQRSFERIRSVDAITPEAELLLGEAARQLHGLESASADVNACLRAARHHLDDVLQAYGQRLSLDP